MKRDRMKPDRRSTLMTILLAAVSLVSVALNYLIFARGKQYYLQLNATRLDPLGLSYHPTDPN